MAGKMDKERITTGVKCILILENQSKISSEEAGDLIKNDPFPSCSFS